MYPTHHLWRAAGRPTANLVDGAQYAVTRRLPASYPPSGPCYLCGMEIDGLGQPTAARFDDATWTGHSFAAAIDSEWLCPACAFSMSEYVERPDLWPKRFKIRCQTHLVAGDAWTVLGLADKRRMQDALLRPPSAPWLLAICDSPLSAGHNVYLTRVNLPGESDWRIMLGRVAVTGSPDRLAEVLTPIETLYAAGHSKSAIGDGDYIPKLINAQGESVWAELEAGLAPLRQTPLFALALFLAQKPNAPEEAA